MRVDKTMPVSLHPATISQQPKPLHFLLSLCCLIDPPFLLLLLPCSAPTNHRKQGTESRLLLPLLLVAMDGGYRSKSYASGRMQIELYTGDARPDFRSLSYGGSGPSYQYQYEYGTGAGQVTTVVEEEEVKRSKSKRRWLALGDPDMERKRRVAVYKAYAMEGKVKGSFRKSFKWMKDRYLHLVYGLS